MKNIIATLTVLLLISCQPNSGRVEDSTLNTGDIVINGEPKELDIKVVGVWKRHMMSCLQEITELEMSDGCRYYYIQGCGETLQFTHKAICSNPKHNFNNCE